MRAMPGRDGPAVRSRQIRPDYDRIARLEWELFGEAFEHAGSDVILVRPPLSFISPPIGRMSMMNIEQSVRMVKAAG